MDSVLLSLKIHGAGLDILELSHSTALLIHQLSCTNSLAELVFQDVQMQDKHDWILNVESMDSSSLKTFGLCERSKRQFESNAEAVDL